MANFNYTVDTKPMADEMRSVSRHVNATTGAVVAMQTAVIIAEEKAADHVCNNVNKGFYSFDSLPNLAENGKTSKRG